MTATEPQRDRRGRIAQAVVVVVPVLLILADLGAATAGGVWASSPSLALTYYPALIALVIAGLISLRTPGQRGNGLIMMGIAGSSAAVDLLTLAGAGPAPFLSGILYWLVIGLLAHLLLRWPGTRVGGRLPRALLWSAYVALPALTLLWQVTWDRAWFGAAAADWWWLTLLANEALSYSLWIVGQGLFLLLIAAVLVVVGLRLARASAEARRMLLPVAIAALLLGLAGVAVIVQSLGVAAPVDAELLANLAMLAVPIAVLIGFALRSRAVGGDPAGRSRSSRVMHRPTATQAALRWTLVAVSAFSVVAAVLLGVAVSTSAGSGAVPQPVPQDAPSPRTDLPGQ